MRPVPVEIAAHDGVTLRGHRHGAGDRWAVLVHEEGRDLDAWRPLLGDLLGLGLAVLAFDLRGHGASDDPWDAARLPDDVAAAVSCAESLGARRLYLLGAGAGATAALAAAGRGVAAIVALSPRGRLEALPADALRRSSAPKLIVVGALDRAAAADADEVYRRSIGWAVLASRADDAQGTGLLASSSGAQVREHVVAFLRDYL